MLRTSRTVAAWAGRADVAGGVAAAGPRAAGGARRAGDAARRCRSSATTSSTRRGGAPRRSRPSGAATAAAWSCGTRSLRGVPWRFSEDVEPYAERVLPLLRATRREHTVALTVIDTLRAGHRFSDQPMLFGWLEDGRRGPRRDQPQPALRRAALRRARRRRARRGAARSAASSVPGVNGDVETVERFAAAWTAGTAAAARRPGSRCGCSRSARSCRPTRRRPAARAPADGRPTSRSRWRWFAAFTRGARPAGTDAGVAGAAADRRRGGCGCGRTRTARRSRSPAAAPRRAASRAIISRLHAARAPRPPLRRRGHGGVRCADALAREAERVVLFTDLDNPAPNAVYQRIGFRPLGDHRVVRFSERCVRALASAVGARRRARWSHGLRRAACRLVEPPPERPAPSTSAPSARTRRASSASEVTTRAPSAPRSCSSATISSSAASRPRREATSDLGVLGGAAARRRRARRSPARRSRRRSASSSRDQPPRRAGAVAPPAVGARADDVGGVDDPGHRRSRSS